MKVRIAQCLCPERHAILGMALADESVADADALQMLRESIALMTSGQGGDLPQFGLPSKIGAHCGLCGAPAASWSYEVHRSKEFDSWEQAQEVLKEMEFENQATKLAMDMLGISYDAEQAREKARNN